MFKNLHTFHLKTSQNRKSDNITYVIKHASQKEKEWNSMEKIEIYNLSSQLEDAELKSTERQC